MTLLQLRNLPKVTIIASFAAVALFGAVVTRASSDTVPVALASGRIINVDVSELSALPPVNSGRGPDNNMAATKGAIIGWYDNGHNYYAEHMRAKAASLGGLNPGNIEGRDLSRADVAAND